MKKSVPFWLLVLLVLISLSDVKGYPKLNFLRDKNSHRQKFEDLSWRSSEQLEKNDHALRREATLQKMQETFGIRNQNEKLAHHKIPQFMIELYNAVSEDTQNRNPYNAKVVRSFIKKDTSLPNFYFFNVSGLEINESVLGAELHLYRKKITVENFPSYPYYLIRLYQVLNDRNLDMLNLHRLLDSYYVGADTSGWQVFNVTQAVFGWLSGEPNLGLLVTVWSLFENKISMEFFRRNSHHNKQPILVLFDDISNKFNPSSKFSSDIYRYQGDKDREVEQESEREEEEKEEENKINLENYNEERSRFKRLPKDGQLEEVMLANRYEPEFFQRSKRRRERKDEKREKNEPVSYESQERETESLMLEAATRRRRRDVTSSKRRTTKIVSKNHTRKIPRVLTSMDIYKRAEFRERLGQKVRNQSTRQRRSIDNENTITIQPNTTECTRHKLYVDFHDIGLSTSILAPDGYYAYQCKGVCESPLRQDQLPTNHATIQAIVHKIGLVKGVEKPCCVPIQLQSINILFSSDSESVVLKNYEDMVAERCGCR